MQACDANVVCEGTLCKNTVNRRQEHKKSLGEKVYIDEYKTKAVIIPMFTTSQNNCYNHSDVHHVADILLRKQPPAVTASFYER